MEMWVNIDTSFPFLFNGNEDFRSLVPKDESNTLTIKSAKDVDGKLTREKFDWSFVFLHLSDNVLRRLWKQRLQLSY